MPLHDQLICGDSREVLAGMETASVDAIVTDPPYALTQMSTGGSPRYNDPTKPYGHRRLADKGFMGQQWDNGRVAHDPAFWAEVLRVAKPGAFLLAFGGTRTYHRLACAIEDAGWEIRDQIVHWLYGSGFPKSGSCLKPSQEPIALAKAPGPLQPLQIDACRVATGDSTMRRSHAEMGYGGGNLAADYTTGSDRGRWPSNLVLSHIGGPDGCRPAGVRRVRGTTGGSHGVDRPIYGGGSGLRRANGGPVVHDADADGDETVDAYQCVEGCPVAALDAQAGPRTSGVKKPHHRRHAAKGWSGPYRDDQDGPAFRSFTGGDTGAASRFFPTFPAADPEPEDAMPFFYSAKASRRERSAGLPDGERSTHPTVKPLALGRWLTRLVAAPGSVVLDPFCGSGTLSAAAVLEGCHYIAVDCDESYCAIARARIAWAQQHRDGPLFAGAEREA